MKTVKCQTCGKIAGDNDIFCTECGTRIERPAKEPVKSKSKIKYIAAVLAVVIIIAAISGIVSHKKLMDNVDIILDRELFWMKGKALPLYAEVQVQTQILMIGSVAFNENWKIGQILNDTYFESITWKDVSANKNERRIHFIGVPKSGDEKVAVGFEFFFNETTGIPMAGRTMDNFLKNGDDDFSVVSVHDAVDKGFDEEFAIAITDILGSGAIMMLSEEGRKSRYSQIIEQYHQGELDDLYFMEEEEPEEEKPAEESYTDQSVTGESMKNAMIYMDCRLDTYGELIKQAKQDNPDYENKGYGYTLYDMDRNGIPELFLYTAAYSEEYAYSVYTILPDERKACLIDRFPGYNKELIGIGETGSIAAQYLYKGEESIYKYTYENERLITRQLYGNSSESADCIPLRGLQQYSLDNLAGLGDTSWQRYDTSWNDSLLQQQGSQGAAASWSIIGRWEYKGCYDWYENDHYMHEPVPETEPLMYTDEREEVIFYDDFTCAVISEYGTTKYSWYYENGYFYMGYCLEPSYEPVSEFYAFYLINGSVLQGMIGDGYIQVYEKAA